MAVAPGHARSAAEGLDDATLALIETEMEGDGVWVDPTFAREHGIGAAEESALEQIVADSDTADLRVVLTTVRYDDDRFSSTDQLAAWMQDDLGGDATWVMWDDDGVALAVFGDQPDPGWVDQMAAHEHPGDVVAQVGRSVELLESGEAQDLWYSLSTEEKYPELDDASGDGLPTWAVVGGIVALIVVGWFVLSWFNFLREKRVAASALRGGFTLPTAVLRGVREAEDRQTLQTAEREVLALGEAIAAAPQSERGRVESWQAALDHYAAARSVLDQGTSPADVVGALVLARRGEDARRTALSGRKEVWTPPATCFFNPLHTGRMTKVTWRTGKVTASVDACRACAAPAERGDEPRDVLDFIHRDATEHYYRLPLGVWSETGYGALDPDLLGALVRSAGKRGRTRRGA
ncbi:MAG: hypothetical protein ACI379_10375 [Nocardioides sp.]|uniref:hypothetical protein n=1 Tax=Nocardioides sp. TaxID=35761 RepID=UPI003F0FE056